MISLKKGAPLSKIDLRSWKNWGFGKKISLRPDSPRERDQRENP